MPLTVFPACKKSQSGSVSILTSALASVVNDTTSFELGGIFGGLFTCLASGASYMSSTTATPSILSPFRSDWSCLIPFSGITAIIDNGTEL